MTNTVSPAATGLSMLSRRALFSSVPFVGAAAVMSSPALTTLANAANVENAENPALIAIWEQFNLLSAQRDEAKATLDQVLRNALAMWPVMPPSIRSKAKPYGDAAACEITKGWGYENGVRQDYSAEHFEWMERSDGLRTPKKQAEWEKTLRKYAPRAALARQYQADCEAVHARVGYSKASTVHYYADRAFFDCLKQAHSIEARTIEGLRIRAAIFLAEIVPFALILPGVEFGRNVLDVLSHDQSATTGVS
jgi:hypothetical protein